MIRFGGYAFRTAREAQEYSRAIMSRYPAPGIRLSDEDEHFYLSVLRAHPDPDQRDKASRIKEIWTAPVQSIYNPYRKDTVTHHIGLQGTPINDGDPGIGISYISIFSHWSGRDRTPKSIRIFKEACRNAAGVHTGRLIGYGNRVHHEGAPFDEIVKRFIQDERIDIGRVEYINPPNAHRIFLDEDLKRRFIDYHAREARLVSIPADLHKEIHAGKGGRQ